MTGSGGGNTSEKMHYVTKDKDTWHDILVGCGVEQAQQQSFLKWLKEVHQMGNSKGIRDAAKTPGSKAIYFRSPMGRKAQKSWKCREGTRGDIHPGTKFPRPRGKEWLNIIDDAVRHERRLTDEHNRNQVAAAAAMAEECYRATGSLFQMEEIMIDPLEKLYSAGEHVTAHDVTDIRNIDKYDVLFYLDKVPGENPTTALQKASKYLDQRGIPIPPKNQKDLASRGNDPSVSMWVQAAEKEWSGIVGRNCFLHDMTRDDLVRRGVLPKKRIVGMRMLYDSKTKSGVFERAKGRCKCAQLYHAPRGPTHDGWDSARGAFWPISRVISTLEIKVRAVW